MFAVVGLTLTETPAAGGWVGGSVFRVTPAPQPATRNAVRSSVQAIHILLIGRDLRVIAKVRSILATTQVWNLHSVKPTGRTTSCGTGCPGQFAGYFSTGKTRLEAWAPP